MHAMILVLMQFLEIKLNKSILKEKFIFSELFRERFSANKNSCIIENAESNDDNNLDCKSFVRNLI